MSAMRGLLFGGTVLAAGFIAVGAWAADAPSPQKPTEVGELVVTGTRLKLPADYTAPNPVTSVTAQTLESRGVVNLTDYLRDIPALTHSLKSEDFANAADRSSVGLNELNLRNLGTQRQTPAAQLISDPRGRPGQGDRHCRLYS